MWSHYRWMTLGVVAVLTACSLGPKYKRPDVPPPAAWLGSVPQPDQAAAVWPSADWWHAFNSPELDELMSEARSANDDIGAAIARVDEADAQAQVAGAALLPSVSAGANGNRARGRSSIATAGGSTGTAGTVNAITNPPTYNLFTPRSPRAMKLTSGVSTTRFTMPHAWPPRRLATTEERSSSP
jgi:outer membrane protein TolC